MDLEQKEIAPVKGKTSSVSPATKFIGLGVLIGVILAFTLVLIGNKVLSKPQSTEKEVLQVTKIDAEGGKTTKQEVTIEFINKRLQNISQLSTAEMVYTGLYSVVEGKIPFITKKGFSMIYTATVRAGIDASSIHIELTDDAVTVTIPKAEVQVSKVDPDSIRFYDEKFALFNKDEKSDVTEAISIAENDMKEKADTDGLLDRANQQAEYIIRALLEDSVGDRRVFIKTR